MRAHHLNSVYETSCFNVVHVNFHYIHADYSYKLN